MSGGAPNLRRPLCGPSNRALSGTLLSDGGRWVSSTFPRFEPFMTGSLFERLGGFARVRLLIADFYERVLDSDRLRTYFDDVDTRRLVDHQTRFISAIMGGPASFSDEQIGRAHRHMGIRDRDFDEMAELLRETLEDHGVDDGDVQRVCAHVLSLRPFVVADVHAPSP
jgi:hemoglobin